MVSQTLLPDLRRATPFQLGAMVVQHALTILVVEEAIRNFMGIHISGKG